MEFKKPKKLEKGDTIAVISPSAGVPSLFPHIFDNGLNVLEELGLKVKEYPTARANADELHGNPKMRAEDINNAFKDTEVKAVFCSIGGDDSVRILPYIDEEVIKNNPKILMGYSDNTTLTTYFNQLGLVTLNGPTIMAGFSQWESMPDKFKQHIESILFENPANYEYTPYENYSNGYPDWGKKENIGKVKELNKSDGWKWLQGTKVSEGELYGGCFEVMEFMKGTDYWPKKDFWDGKILFFETSEDKPSPDQVKWWLRNYGSQGILDKIRGLVIGRARDYSAEENDKLYANITSVVSGEFGRDDLPIIANFDFGHTDPQNIMPLGIKAEIDCNKKTFSLLESVLE